MTRLQLRQRRELRDLLAARVARDRRCIALAIANLRRWQGALMGPVTATRFAAWMQARAHHYVAIYRRDLADRRASYRRHWRQLLQLRAQLAAKHRHQEAA